MAGYTGTVRPYNKGIIKGAYGTYIQMRGKTVQEKINYFFKHYINYIYIGMSMKFAQTAAKYTPPNMGKAYIDQKYYSRPIYKLDDLAKGLVRTARGRRVYATKEDFAALRAGYKFKVVNTKYRITREQKRKAIAYTKGINEAKRLAKIERRGLSKYSWGANINNTMQDIQNQTSSGIPLNQVHIFTANKLPPIFQRLARKSPAITKYTWGSYRKEVITNEQDVKGMRFTIVNRMAEIQAYGRIAINQGIKAVRRYTNAIWKAVGALGNAQTQFEDKDDPNKLALTELRQSLKNMFEDSSKKYQINEIFDIKEDNSVPNGTIQLRRG